MGNDINFDTSAKKNEALIFDKFKKNKIEINFIKSKIVHFN